MGLITKGEEDSYRKEVRRLAEWGDYNSLLLNTKKTKELIVDFRNSRKSKLLPLFLNNEEVERVDRIKFLGVNFSEDLSWSTHISAVVCKAQQRLFFF